MFRAKSLLALSAVLLSAAPLLAGVRPNPLFSDHMVLQRGVAVPVWGAAEDGESVTVEFQGQTQKTQAKDGKWMVRLDPLEAAGPATMTISGKNKLTIKDVLVGEVWVCSGQSNMQWSVAQSADPQKTIAASANERLRLLTVPRQATPEKQETAEVRWVVCGPETVKDFSAVGYAFGKELEAKLGVPVGLINTSYGGTPAEAWTSRETLEADPAYRELLAACAAMPANSPHRASGLFNAMIHPLLPYAIRGAIWYQGESNASRAEQYKTLFPAMIQDWRKAWGQGDFPFLFVQLAPFQAIVQEPAESDWAELREAQRLTLKKVAKTGMAVITDLGDEKDIHPKAKAPVGKRLALAALGIAYGQPVVSSGPEFESMRVESGKAILKFKNAEGGLVSKGGPPAGFTIAGADGKFVNAQAEIEGDEVVVWSPKVAEPVAVRYGWANYPVVNLWNKQGLPASPFKTDDFPWLTKGRTAPGR